MPESARPVLERLLPEAIAFLKELVEINSYTWNQEGVEANATRIIQQFAPLGFTARHLPCNLAKTGRHLFLDSGGSGPAILMVSHLDTVFSAEEEELNDFHWREEANGRIYGPGTIDIKGGTAMIWLMLAALAEADPERFHSVRWLLAWDAVEEIGASEAFAEQCRAACPPEVIACLVFEPDSAQDDSFAILRARKGLAAYHLKVGGRGAHAGVRPEAGANAIHQLARTIDQLQALNDFLQGISLNTGIIQGGTATNRVPHEATAFFEMRAYDPALFEQTHQRILAFSGTGEVQAFSDPFSCTVEITPLRTTPPWPQNEPTDQLINLWQEAADALGYTLRPQARGGVSDGNFLARWFPSLDGLGPRGGNAHCSEASSDGTKDQEYVDSSSFVPKAELNLTAIRRLLHQSR